MRVDRDTQRAGRDENGAADSGPGAAARHLLTAPIDALLGRISATLTTRYPGLADRLRAMGPATVLVVPTDLPAGFVIETGHKGLALRVMLPGETPAAGTRVSAPLSTLLALAECRMDADAIFFDRTLAIDGDIEPVLALRNAIESESIDVTESVLAAFGPLSGAARHLGWVARDVLEIAAPVIDSAARFALRPVLDRLDTLEQAVGRLARSAPLEPQKRGS
jgi:predicted lipid carrier protein YhbT